MIDDTPYYVLPGVGVILDGSGSPTALVVDKPARIDFAELLTAIRQCQEKLKAANPDLFEEEIEDTRQPEKNEAALNLALDVMHQVSSLVGMLR